MSNSLAIAAVTATLENLLSAVSDDVFGATVTTLPLDKAHEDTGNRINLFLYQTTVNTAWSNMGMPGRVKPGESGHPPLALNLHYLLTAYGEDDNDLKFVSHRLLGRAMSILHDKPVLERETIENVLPGNDLYQQIERVHLTPQPLSVDDMSKLWTTFQTPYQISAAYQASVVLIESTRPVKTPLPVLQRGRDDEGVFSDLLPLPALTRIELPPRQPSLRLGDKLTVRGECLEGALVLVRLRHFRLGEPVTLQPQPGATATKLTIQLPITDHALHPAGLYTLAAIVTQEPEGRGPLEWVTNELSFALAPLITIPEKPVGLDRDPDRAILKLECKPDVWPTQQVSVLLGSFESVADSHPGKTNALTFDVSDIPVGRYLVRLRVDGVDSLPIASFEESAGPLTFDERQKVTLVPQVIIPENPVRQDPDDATRIFLVLRCKPDVWPDQRAILLIDNAEIEARVHPKKTDTLTFDITGVAAGEHPIHLRVDEVTSAPDEEQVVIVP